MKRTFLAVFTLDIRRLKNPQQPYTISVMEIDAPGSLLNGRAERWRKFARRYKMCHLHMDKVLPPSRIGEMLPRDEWGYGSMEIKVSGNLVEISDGVGSPDTYRFYASKVA